MARGLMEAAAQAIDDYRALAVAEADLGAKIDAIAAELRRIDPPRGENGRRPS